MGERGVREGGSGIVEGGKGRLSGNGGSTYNTLITHI